MSKCWLSVLSHRDCPCRESVVAACGGDHMAAVIRVTANISSWGNIGASVANAVGVYTPRRVRFQSAVGEATGRKSLKELNVRKVTLKFRGLEPRHESIAAHPGTETGRVDSADRALSW